MSTAAVIKEAARILDEEGIEDARVVNLLEMGSDGSVLIVADEGGSLSIRESRRQWRIGRDGYRGESWYSNARPAPTNQSEELKP